MSAYSIVKLDESMVFIYNETNGSKRRILYRTITAGQLSPEENLLADADPQFSVTVDGQTIYVFAQNKAGVQLMTYREGAWHERTVLSANAEDVLLTPMLTDRGLHIIYNTAENNGKTHYLDMRQRNANGWAPPTRIDKLEPMRPSPYKAQATSKEHLLLFYKTRGTEHQLGYREITPTRTGPYCCFYSGAHFVGDAAFLTTDDAVHVLYVVKSGFSCQLIYQRKTDDVFSTPALLWESPSIDHCLLSIIAGRLYATGLIGDRLYEAVSDDMGASFTRMQIYKNKFCYEPVKADFYTAAPQSVGGLYTRQAYVDRNRPWDVQILPDYYAPFFA